MSTATAPMPRLLYRPEEAAEVLALGRSTIYELMAAGNLRFVKCGRSRRIHHTELERFAAALSDQSR
ncbi:helix-turn-helix domain-containing protein [Actinacidiphila acididurans]|uniref:Excisionase family DNA-binding protein n=1 Tax=Actinacidiphila acididurans TaxID=2784346 RepID=A0ABS2TS34_9ACTN|nr:helix-turn-helix domain-containing protein [Actinacidiphila acididurans]MBM9505316.1 excisionase family DNA-binding protein [Actinacidiphila acididurans]